jgi:tetratricopeptide (TPR) repeat protein
MNLGVLLLVSGRVDEGIAQTSRAIELDPLTLRYRGFQGQLLIRVRRYEEAIAALQQVIELEPSFFGWHQSLALAYQLNGQTEEARAALAVSRRLIGEEIRLRSVAPFAYVYATVGEAQTTREMLARIEASAADLEIVPVDAGFAYAALGDRDAAFRWLEAALGERNRELLFLQTHPGFDPLRPDPRFAELLRRTRSQSGGPV